MWNTDDVIDCVTQSDLFMGLFLKVYYLMLLCDSTCMHVRRFCC